MRAIILAAGGGTRLRPHTDDKPKCLVPLCGRPLLDYQLDILREAGVDDIHLVTGYRSEQLESYGLPTHLNPRYAETNMVESLFCARSALEGDVIIAYGDIVYERKVIDALLQETAPFSTVVDEQWESYWKLRLEDPLTDAETLKLDGDGCILELGKKPKRLDEIEAQYIGLTALKGDQTAAFVRAYDSLDREGTYDGRPMEQMYMTSFLQHLIDHGNRLKAVKIQRGWLEVDTTDDLALYHELNEKGLLKRECGLFQASSVGT